jgi:Transaldolase/Fructose-6-phosphate aldolase
VNITLCFSQQQAAAVYSATRDTRTPVYVSPFVGRLDDIGQNGIDLIGNVKRMFAKGDGHVLVLAASIRSLDHLLSCFALDTELVTVPAKVLTLWAENNFPLPGEGFAHKSTGRPIRLKSSIWNNRGSLLISATSSLRKESTSSLLTIVRPSLRIEAIGQALVVSVPHLG